MREGIVQEFFEKVKNPPTHLAKGAVYICEPSILQFIKSLNKEGVDFSLEVIPNYLNKINTFINSAYHRDIGTPESYALSMREILKLPTHSL